jgi:hypothetical protein
MGFFGTYICFACRPATFDVGEGEWGCEDHLEGYGCGEEEEVDEGGCGGEVHGCGGLLMPEGGWWLL